MTPNPSPGAHPKPWLDPERWLHLGPRGVGVTGLILIAAASVLGGIASAHHSRVHALVYLAIPLGIGGFFLIMWWIEEGGERYVPGEVRPDRERRRKPPDR